jgi:hypothetical protein
MNMLGMLHMPSLEGVKHGDDGPKTIKLKKRGLSYN